MKSVTIILHHVDSNDIFLIFTFFAYVFIIFMIDNVLSYDNVFFIQFYIIFHFLQIPRRNTGDNNETDFFCKEFVSKSFGIFFHISMFSLIFLLLVFILKLTKNFGCFHRVFKLSLCYLTFLGC